MRRVLVYNPFAGISGDMHMGAMVDLGVPESFIIESLQSLKLPGWSVEFKKEQRKGITGTRALVKIEQESQNHNHHGQVGHKHHIHHEHRNLNDIVNIITTSGLDDSVKNLSLKIFSIVAEAESKVHDKPVSEVHFHEVGALDSIIDIVAASAAINYLNPDLIISTAPELGGGFVECAHGTIPVPAPATVEILKGTLTRQGTVQYETTTPTGAAILAAVTDKFTNNPELKIIKTGYGVGTKDNEIPNLLRVYLGEIQDKEKDNTVMIECNIDDMNPELYEWVTDSLFKAGAKDLYLTSVIMKKGRPGTLISVMANPENKEEIYRILFSETTTVGAREYPVSQTMLERENEEMNTPYGKVRIKKSFYKGNQVSAKAEYEDVRKLSEKHNIPMKTIYETLKGE